jgi:hypothetical protein
MYAKILNEQIYTYPYPYEDLKRDNPYTSFPLVPVPSDLAEYGVVVVESVPKPADTLTTTVNETLPVKENGTWKQSWIVEPATQQEIDSRLAAQALRVRSQRNGLLSQSDWTQVLDAPVDQQAWATYRQTLRDITQQSGFPVQVTWPQQPE